MPKKMGRPTKNPKNVSLQIRITKDTADDLQECADELGTTRVAVIEKGIELVKSQINKKK